MPKLLIKTNEKILHFIFAEGVNVYGKCTADTTSIEKVFALFKEIIPQIADLHFFSEDLRKCLTEDDFTLPIKLLFIEKHSVHKFQVYHKTTCYHCKRKLLMDKLSEIDFDGDIEICVNTLTGKKLICYVKPTDKIGAVKEQIFLQWGGYILPEQQRLLFEKKELENHCTIDDYKLTSESQVIFRLVPIDMKYRYTNVQKYMLNIDPNMKTSTPTSDTILVEVPDNKHDEVVIKPPEIDKPQTKDEGNCRIL